MTPKKSRSIEASWSFVATEDGSSLVLPDGRCDIIIRRSVGGLPVPIVTGPATQPYVVTYEAGDSWLSIRLRPENGVAVWEGQIGSAADNVLRGDDALALLPALCGEGITLADMADLVPLPPVRPIDGRLVRSLDAIHASGGRLRVDRLAQYVACSPRHLNRIFRAHVGLTAKMYARLVQFHRVLRLIIEERFAISEAAFEGGYADHAHLTRAFRRFGGFLPSDVPQALALPRLFG